MEMKKLKKLKKKRAGELRENNYIWSEPEKQEYNKYHYLLEMFIENRKIWDNDIRDYLQKKFSEAFRNYIDIAPLNKYLMNVLTKAYNQYWINQVRKRKKMDTILFSELPTEEKDVAQTIDEFFTINIETGKIESTPEKFIKLLYKMLTWKQQQFAYYRFYLGFDYSQIATIMGTTVQNLYAMRDRIKNRASCCAMFDFGAEGNGKLIDMNTGEIVS